MTTLTQPLAIEVTAQGHIALAPEQVLQMGFKGGDQLMLVPLENGQFLLMQPDKPAITREALSEMMQRSFQAAGYQTQESIIELIRDVKSEMAQAS